MYKLFLIHFCLISFFSWLFRFYVAYQTVTNQLQNTFLTFLYSVTFDFHVALFSFIPFLCVIICAAVFKKIDIKKAFSRFVFFETILLILTLICEYIFFQEFNDRFNFIAVDYLVYTNEVVANIWQSYHVIVIFFAVIILSIILNKLFYKKIIAKLKTDSVQKKIIFAQVLIYAGVTFAAFQFLSERSLLLNLTTNEGRLAKNGLHSLISAYFYNEIDFDHFYTTELDDGHARVSRYIASVENPKKYNVVLVLMESMSARYMNYFGNKENISPYLDRLIDQSLFFDSMYSTGTRTVRGIEATVLSIPPTPGQSIVRRPDSEVLYNIATVFNKYGYENKFIYGGESYFDNMKQFFQTNHFNIVDQNNFKSEEIHFSNAWGVSDEDLFDKVISESDKSYQNEKPFFNYVLTTSNHRPYTYPDKIDIPSGSGRSGAVKYSDFAISQFIEKAKTKPWFVSTIFVFISDHNASVAGGEKIIPEDYHIPFIIYAPHIVKPEIKKGIVSQIDVAPTLFGILGFEYQSRFFGEDLTKVSPDRAYLATYQKIALFKNHDLVVLSPNKVIKEYKTNEDNNQVKLVKSFVKPYLDDDSDQMTTEAVKTYNMAYDTFKLHALKENQVQQQNIK